MLLLHITNLGKQVVHAKGFLMRSKAKKKFI